VANFTCHLFVGWGLARSGQLGEAAESAHFLRESADTSTLSALGADLIEGTMAAEEGRVDDARRLLDPISRGTTNPALLARLLLAELAAAEGNSAEAIRLYSGVMHTYSRFLATLSLARVHEQRGEIEEARSHYRRFLTITRSGDPDLPEVVEAKAALARLGG
jgi:hypothetical protein